MPQQHIVTEQEKREICRWHYPEEYAACALEDF